MNIAIILSGGIGTRMGMELPKQYIEVNGKPIIWYCLKTFVDNSNVDMLCIVRAEEWDEYIKKQIQDLGANKTIIFANPGETRQFSIFNALKAIATIRPYDDEDRVIIHDAARPLVSHALINSCLESCKDADAVLPVIQVKDTLYQSVDGEHITNLLKRNEVFAGQAPEAFVFSKYMLLHETMPREELLTVNGSTEIAYKGRLKIKLIKGEEMNFKITTLDDLSNFESIIKNESIRPA